MFPSASQIVSDQRVRKSVFLKFYKSTEIDLKSIYNLVMIMTETFLQYDQNPLLDNWIEFGKTTMQQQFSCQFF